MLLVLNTLLKNNKGAMFGIDARIAMLIFAALSLSVGAFSFNNVTKARNARLIKDVTEVAEAIDEYQNSMRNFMMFTVEDGTENHFDVLIRKDNVKEKYLNRWNGPYFSTPSLTNDHPLYGEYSLDYKTEDRKECDYETKCYVWVKLTGVPENRAVYMNKYIDEQGGQKPETSPTTMGKVRIEDFGTLKTIYYRGPSRKAN